MKAVINGFTWLIDTIKMLVGIVMSIFNTLAMVIRYFIVIVGIAIDVVANLPDWLRAFALITISISIAYFLIGRNSGKSD